MSQHNHHAEVLGREAQEIRKRRRLPPLIGPQLPAPADLAEMEPTGLSLSGGGIRAACFSLGFLEKLDRVASPSSPATPPSGQGQPPTPVAEPRCLEEFDYVSAVSGGSYALGHLITTTLPGSHLSRLGDIEFSSKTVPGWLWGAGVFFLGVAFQLLKTGSLVVAFLATLSLILRSLDSPDSMRFWGALGLYSDVARGFVPFWLTLWIFLTGYGIEFVTNSWRWTRLWFIWSTAVIASYLVDIWSLGAVYPAMTGDFSFNLQFMHLAALFVPTMFACLGYVVSRSRMDSLRCLGSFSGARVVAVVGGTILLTGVIVVWIVPAFRAAFAEIFGDGFRGLSAFVAVIAIAVGLLERQAIGRMLGTLPWGGPSKIDRIHALASARARRLGLITVRRVRRIVVRRSDAAGFRRGKWAVSMRLAATRALRLWLRNGPSSTYPGLRLSLLIPLLAALFCLAGLMSTGDIGFYNAADDPIQVDKIMNAGRRYGELGDRLYWLLTLALGLTSVGLLFPSRLFKSVRQVEDSDRGRKPGDEAKRLGWIREPVYRVIVFLCSYGFVLLVVFLTYSTVAAEDISSYFTWRENLRAPAIHIGDIRNWDLAWQRIDRDAHKPSSEEKWSKLAKKLMEAREKAAFPIEQERWLTTEARVQEALPWGRRVLGLFLRLRMPTAWDAEHTRPDSNSRDAKFQDAGPWDGKGWNDPLWGAGSPALYSSEPLSTFVAAIRSTAAMTIASVSQVVSPLLQHQIGQVVFAPWIRESVDLRDPPEATSVSAARAFELRGRIERGQNRILREVQQVLEDPNLTTLVSKAEIVGEGSSMTKGLATIFGGSVKEEDEKLRVGLALARILNRVASGGAVGDGDGLTNAVTTILDRAASGPEVAAQERAADASKRKRVRELADEYWTRAESLNSDEEVARNQRPRRDPDYLAAVSSNNRRLLQLYLGDQLLYDRRENVVFSVIVWAEDQWARTWVAASACLLWLVCCAVNPNTFSLQKFYRRHVIDSWIAPGAGNDRRGPWLDGVDDTYRGGDGSRRRAPFPLIHATLEGNRSLGNEPDLPDHIFTFSPLASGCGTGRPAGQQHWRTRAGKNGDFARDNELDLGNIVATSGAFLSPGTVANPALSALLHLLSVQTGYWAHEPERYERRSIGESIKFHVCQSLGIDCEGDSRFMLTDGAHVENLGLYALLVRRCKLIVAVDCSQEDRGALPERRFDALVQVLQQAESDGIHVGPFLNSFAFDKWRKSRAKLPIQGGRFGCDRRRAVGLDLLLPEPKDNQRPDDDTSQEHYVFAELRYPEGGEALLVYLRPTLTGDEGDGLLLAGRSSAFPDDDPVDQFYTPAKMSQYRLLGRHIAKELVNDPIFRENFPQPLRPAPPAKVPAGHGGPANGQVVHNGHSQGLQCLWCSKVAGNPCQWRRPREFRC